MDEVGDAVEDVEDVVDAVYVIRKETRDSRRSAIEINRSVSRSRIRNSLKTIVWMNRLSLLRQEMVDCSMASR